MLDWLRSSLTTSLAQQSERYDADPVASRRGQSLLDAVRSTLGGPFYISLAQAITKLIELLLDGALESLPAQLLATWLEKEMPYVIDTILDPFVTLGSEPWQDTWMCGLPMDNQMDDQLWPTDFTELWIPIEKTAQVMRALRTFFAGGGDPKKAYDHTGSFSCELYATAPSPFWMSPSYGGAMFRVDVFWFALNSGMPTDEFYPRFWRLLKQFNFRPHWGKYLPPPRQSGSRTTGPTCPCSSASSLCAPSSIPSRSSSRATGAVTWGSRRCSDVGASGESRNLTQRRKGAKAQRSEESSDFASLCR